MKVPHAYFATKSLQMQQSGNSKCDYCGSRYKRKEQLEAHITSTHEADSEKFECDNCSKTFSTLNNKRRHFYTIHNKVSEDHKCLHCEKSCGRKDILSKHVNQCHSA